MVTKVTIIIPQEFVRSMQEFLMKTGEKSAEEIKELARELVPVNTGKLRDSIKIEKDGSDFIIGSDEEYSGFVEYGTLRQSPQPFMRPALNDIVAQNQNS